jgi:hypothetical protein
MVEHETCTLDGNKTYVEVPTWYDWMWIEICLGWRCEAAGLYRL